MKPDIKRRILVIVQLDDLCRDPQMSDDNQKALRQIRDERIAELSPDERKWLVWL